MLKISVNIFIRVMGTFSVQIIIKVITAHHAVYKLISENIDLYNT